MTVLDLMKLLAEYDGHKDVMDADGVDISHIEEDQDGLYICSEED